jgi:hypothetical protein
MMTRKTFLSIVGLIALAIGSFALFAPALLLAAKGVSPSDAANVWVREVGISVTALGLVTLLARGDGDSPTLRAFLIGNAVLQVGLFPIEIVAYAQGIITEMSGVLPNSILHLLLAAGFLYFAARIKTPARDRSSSALDLHRP